MITPLEKTLLSVMILVIMFGLGCSLSPKDVKSAAKSPRPVAIGFLSQYLFMPLLAYGMAVLLDLDRLAAIGIIIVACCPSGTTSSLFNYFAKGNLALSISLSSITTAAALVAMPILLAIYAGPFQGDDIRIDIAEVMKSLVACLVPVAGGLFLRSRSERWAKNMEETGAALGIVVILFLIASWLPRNLDRMLQADIAILVVSITLGLGGFLFGYLLSRALGLPPRSCRPVSLETGIQNGPLAFAIILFSFSDEAIAAQILWPALLYSFFIVNTASLVTFYMRRAARSEWFHQENAEVKEALFKEGWLRP